LKPSSINSFAKQIAQKVFAGSLQDNKMMTTALVDFRNEKTQFPSVPLLSMKTATAKRNVANAKISTPIESRCGVQ
jgi:hypothetical protein